MVRTVRLDASVGPEREGVRHERASRRRGVHARRADTCRSLSRASRAGCTARPTYRASSWRRIAWSRCSRRRRGPGVAGGGLGVASPSRYSGCRASQVRGQAESRHEVGTRSRRQYPLPPFGCPVPLQHSVDQLRGNAASLSEEPPTGSASGCLGRRQSGRVGRSAPERSCFDAQPGVARTEPEKAVPALAAA